MRSPSEMATIQIELTSACVLKCSNCTRFCGTHKVPFFMEPEMFMSAIDSLVGWVKEMPQGIVGFMGGEPLLHPQFEEFCDYALTKIPRERLGLWSTFPAGGKYPKYRDVICRTFANVLLNDHSRDDILHAPVLMGSEEFFRKVCPDCDGRKTVPDIQPGMGFPYAVPGSVPCETCKGEGTIVNERELLHQTEHCWVQESWSAAINPKGAFFCEVAAAMTDLFDGPPGWKVEPDWWKRTPMEFAEQRKYACHKCGAAMPIKRIRNSQDPRDDVSPRNLERLKAVGSRKVSRGEYEVRDFQFDAKLTENHGYPRQTYQEEIYRKTIAARYGIGLVMNARGYWEPRLLENLPKPEPSLFHILSERYPVGQSKAVDASGTSA
jgi:hypothetical protein